LNGTQPLEFTVNAAPHPLCLGVLSLMMLICSSACVCRAQPATDMFANRIVITGTNIVVTSSSVGATRETGEPYHAGNTGGASVWWSWTEFSNGAVTMSTAGSCFRHGAAAEIGCRVRA
jgi:hypothetical protein